jgi:hypothetical protein
MTVVSENVRAILDHIIVVEMEFEEIKRSSGVIIPTQNGKSEGIMPRWGKVHAVGPQQKLIKVGEWVLVEHGRWTRGFKIKAEDGKECEARRVDAEAVLLVSDTPPSAEDIFNPTF